MDWKQILNALSELRDASFAAGAYPITQGEGLILYTLALASAARFGGAVVFEAGAGVGYSTAWLLLGIEHGGGGLVYAVERSPDRAGKLIEAVKRLGLGNRLRLLVGDAIEAARRVDEEIHMVFIDIEKSRYVELFKAVEDKVVEGGLVVAHNAWMVPGYVRYVKGKSGWATSIVHSSEGLVVSIKVSGSTRR